MGVNSTLTLLYEKFDESLLKMGDFLGSTEAEVGWAHGHVTHTNASPDHDPPQISAKSFQVLQRLLDPLDYLYSLVLAEFAGAPESVYPRTAATSASCVSVRSRESLRGA